MKIFTTPDGAQDVIAALRNVGEQATLLSLDQEQNRAVVVTRIIPESVQWIRLATEIVEDK